MSSCNCMVRFLWLAAVVVAVFHVVEAKTNQEVRDCETKTKKECAESCAASDAQRVKITACFANGTGLPNDIKDEVKQCLDALGLAPTADCVKKPDKGNHGPKHGGSHPGSHSHEEPPQQVKDFFDCVHACHNRTDSQEGRCDADCPELAEDKERAVKDCMKKQGPPGSKPGFGPPQSNTIQGPRGGKGPRGPGGKGPHPKPAWVTCLKNVVSEGTTSN